MAALISALAPIYIGVQKDRLDDQRDLLENRVRELEIKTEEFKKKNEVLKVQLEEAQNRLTDIRRPNRMTGDEEAQQAQDRPVENAQTPIDQIERQSRAGLTFDDIDAKNVAREEGEGHWAQGFTGVGFQIIRGLPVFNRVFGRGPVICSEPVSQDRPAILEITVVEPRLTFSVRSHPYGDSKLEVWTGDRFLFGEVIDQRGSWKEVSVDIPRDVRRIQLRHIATGWSYEFLYFDFKIQ